MAESTGCFFNYSLGFSDFVTQHKLFKGYNLKITLKNPACIRYFIHYKFETKIVAHSVFCKIFYFYQTKLVDPIEN